MAELDLHLASVLARLPLFLHQSRHFPRYFQCSLRVLLNGSPRERQEPRVRRVTGAVNAAEKYRVFVGHFNGISELLRGVIEVKDVVFGEFQCHGRR